RAPHARPSFPTRRSSDLGMTDNDMTATAIEQHSGGDFAGVGTVLMLAQRLRAELYAAARQDISHPLEVGKGGAQDRFASGRCRCDGTGKLCRHGITAMHLPVARYNFSSCHDAVSLFCVS